MMDKQFVLSLKPQKAEIGFAKLEMRPRSATVDVNSEALPMRRAAAELSCSSSPVRARSILITRLRSESSHQESPNFLTVPAGISLKAAIAPPGQRDPHAEPMAIERMIDDPGRLTQAVEFGRRLM